jgi:hypothetical protein
MSIGDGETATKMALKAAQIVFKHTETHSCEGRFLNLCRSMGNKEKGRGAFLMIDLKIS